MSYWWKTTLGEVVEFTNGGAWNQSEYTEAGIPVVRVSDIQDGTISLDNCKFLAENSLTKYRKHLLDTGDVVIATVGSHPTQPASVVGRVAKVPFSAENALLNQNAVRLKPSVTKLDRGYLLYLALSPTFRGYIIAHARGSANQVRVAIAALRDMPLTLPPANEQARIATILSAYDDLIENNTRRIRILEEVAQVIYREWFVNFRFPGYESFRMVESELGQIPQDWHVERLDKLARITMGQSPPSKYYNTEGKGLPFHQGVTNFGKLFPENRMYCTLEQRIAETGDILLSVRAPVGRMNITLSKIVIGRGLCALRSLLGWQPLLFQQLRDRFHEEDTMGSGTIFKAVTKEDICGLRFLCPEVSIGGRFTELIGPMFEELEVLSAQISNLRQTRDLLLPKLISGQVSVDHIETKIAAQVS